MTMETLKKSNFFDFTTKRPVAIIMIVAGIMVFGWLSYNQLALNLMPDISYPSLTVRTEYPGTAPEEVETTVSRPIEEALGVVGNLYNISSVSKAGQSDVILEFDWETDMDQAIGEVREKLDLVFLPEDAQKPIILRYDPSLDPIIRVGLTGGTDLFYGRYIAEEQIKRELETVPGVAAVKVKGGLEEEIWVELDEKKITLLGLDIQQIRQQLAAENLNLAGGNLKEGQTEYVVRTLNEFKTVDEIGNILIRLGNNHEIRLKDIGKVYRTNKERQIITRLNGRESVELEVYKEGDANIVEVAALVRDRIFGSAEQQSYVRRMKAGESRADQKASSEQKGTSRPVNRRKLFQQQLLKRQMTGFINYNLPKPWKVGLLTDQSVFINNSINEVKKSALQGGLLAIIVLFFFLHNFRTTFIVALSIPISIVATFAPMRLFDVSLNIMSLGGLALGIGMLVDNSIVVTESIYRCKEEGDSLMQAVVRGASEVGAAVSASTLTTIAVFFPMVFVKGIAGQIFGDLALTVVFSLLASLAVALFFIPMLASRQLNLKSITRRDETAGEFFRKFSSVEQLKRSFAGIKERFSLAGSRRKIFLWLSVPLIFMYVLSRFLFLLLLNLIGKFLTSVLLIVGGIVAGMGWMYRKFLSIPINYLLHLFEMGMKGIYTRYPIILGWALNNRSAVILSALVPFLLVAVVLLPGLGRELIPEVHQGEFNVELRLPVGTPVEQTARSVEQIEKMILNLPDVERIATVAGVDLSKISTTEEGEHTAKITVSLKPTDDVVAAEERVMRSIRRRLSEFGGMDHKISRPVLFTFKTPLEIEIKGYNLDKLSALSAETVQRISQIPGVFDVKSNLQTGNPEVRIVYNRARLAYLGLNILDVANIVRNKVRGDVATQFKQEDRRIDVRVKVRETDKETIEKLKRLNINPNGTVPIPLTSVADIRLEEGPSEIRRINQQRSAVVMANIVGRDLLSVSSDVFQAIQNINFPADFTYEIAGQNKEMEVSLGSLRLALLLAIFMVYIVMASQFESFLHPFVILFTVPLALIGVVSVLWILGIPLNVMVFLGLIMLAGIVVNNAIVLVDYINQLRRRGLEKKEAILKAGQARLRPILMTSATTILGLLPMALGLGDGAEIRTPMAITVIAGLISATLLTLVVIPTVYAVFEKGD